MRKKINLIQCIAASNFRRLSSPYKATFILTYRCNLRCEICRIWEHPPSKEMGALEIGKVFKSLKNLSWIDLSGGEITLRNDVVEVVRTIIKNSSKLLVFHISTNGQRPERTELIADEILKGGLLPVINVSIDGPQELNDRLRGARGAFANSVETFLRLKKMRLGHCYLSCTLSRHNMEHIEQLLRELEKEVSGFSHSDIHFNLFHTSAHYYKNNTASSSEKADPAIIKKYLSLSRKGHFLKFFLENEYLKGVSKFLSGDRFPKKCQALNATCFIDPSGTVYPCGIYDEPVGFLSNYDYDMDQLWDQPDVLKVRKKIEQRHCSGCWSPCEAYPAILGGLMRRSKNGQPFLSQ
ncbi:MAG: radical SAM protein [Candidatus Omnitrophota bacterium]